MSLIKKFGPAVIVYFLCYTVLVVGDWAISKFLLDHSSLGPDYQEALSIEAERVDNEDASAIAKAKSNGLSPVVYPSLMDDLKVRNPLIAGFPNVSTYFCNEGAGLVTYVSDRFGFRNSDELWDAHLDAIMIGDSFVHGACVSDDEVLSVQVSRFGSRSVLNLGMSDNNPSHYITYLHLFVPRLHPQTVYLVFYANDNGVRAKSRIETHYIDERQQFFHENRISYFDDQLQNDTVRHIKSKLDKVKTNGDVDEKDPVWIERLINRLLYRVTLPTLTGLFLNQAREFDLTQRSIVSGNEICHKFGCDLTIVYIPNSKFFRPDSRSDQYAERIEREAARLNLRFIDGRKVLDRERGSVDFALKGPHLSAEGYRKLAMAIVSE